MSNFASDTFPREITEAILFRLPLKSLGRLKSVSKAWYSLISDPYFIRHLYKPTKLILRSNNSSLYSVDISTLDNLSATLIKQVVFPSPHLIEWKRTLGSCNGLVLAVDVYDKLFLMNPTTRELWAVPQNPFKLPVDKRAIRLDIYGFGYVPSTDDYKIVLMLLCGVSGSVVIVSLYSLRDNSWKKLVNAPYDHRCSYTSLGALVNHNLHWVTRARAVYLTIIAFNLENEEFNEIQFPESIEKGDLISYDTLVFCGKLALFETDNYLWVMEEYGVAKSWTKVCCFHGVDGIYVNPVCLVEGSYGDIVLRLNHSDTMVLVYNIDEKRWRNVHIDGVTSRFFVEGTYVESLESPAKYIRTGP